MSTTLFLSHQFPPYNKKTYNMFRLQLPSGHPCRQDKHTQHNSMEGEKRKTAYKHVLIRQHAVQLLSSQNQQVELFQQDEGSRCKVPLGPRTCRIGHAKAHTHGDTQTGIRLRTNECLHVKNTNRLQVQGRGRKPYENKIGGKK